MIKQTNYPRLVLFFLLLVAGAIAVWSFCASEATFDVGDGVRHYQESRYFFQHPELFFDLWGKPFFILISSPFAQFGMAGMNIFQVLCAILSSLCCYAIARKLRLHFAFVIPLFIFFAPIYFSTLNSGLTEPFFGLILISSVYLLFTGRYHWGAVLVSVLPYVRTEGYLVLPFFCMLFLYRRKCLPVFLLISGTLVIWLTGVFHFHDFKWMISHHPYKYHSDIYGTGANLFYYANANKEILGNPLSYLFIAGLLALILRLVFFKRTKEKGETAYFPEEFFLIYGSALSYFIAHSIFYWRGLFTDMGLIRVMAGIIPPVSLICLRGITFFTGYLKKKWLQLIPLMAFCALVVREPFRQHLFRQQPNVPMKLISDAALWYKSNLNQDRTVFYLYPYLIYKMDKDPFDRSKVGELWSFDPEHPENYDDGTLIFWDAHFGPNEGNLPLGKLMNDNHYRLLKVFTPAENWIVLGGRKFEIYVFEKINPEKVNVHVLDEKVAWYISKIKSDSVWLRDVTRKADSIHISQDSIMKQEAVWMIQNVN